MCSRVLRARVHTRGKQEIVGTSDIEEMVYFRVKVSTPMSLRDRRPAGIVGGNIPLPHKLDGLVSQEEWTKRVDHFNNEAVMVMRNEISCQEAVARVCSQSVAAHVASITGRMRWRRRE